jgi:HipA-like protein
MIEELHAIVAHQPMGVVRWDRKRNLLGFHYAEEWRESPSAFPLSMSMPLASGGHRHEVVAAFLWGLLPDNRVVLDQWGKKFQVSSGNVFRLLWHVGEECAGAVQFVRPSRWEEFIDALILNWLISGTDAHAKNYSFLMAEGGQVRLAPLYDISSSLPYSQTVDPRKARLAMRIGEKYRVNEIGGYDWEKSAAEWGCSPDGMTARIKQIAGLVPEAARRTAEDLQSVGIDHEIVMDLADRIEERSVRFC